MPHKKHPTPFISPGSSSLLVVFLVLAIMIFAVLSFVSAKNDYHYSLKMANAKKDYYQACNRAEEMLKELSSSFEPKEETGGFKIPIDDYRQLSVQYAILQGEKNPSYKITEWKVEMRNTWEGKNTLNLPSFLPGIP